MTRLALFTLRWMARLTLGGWLLVIILSGAESWAQTIGPDVLILNSYHPGEQWSDRELAGIMATLKRSDPNWVPMVEHLDAKRFPNPAHLALMKDYLARKYQGRRIDLLIVLDNPALDLMLKYRSELFPHVPIVFAGINGFEPAMLQGQEQVTGITEVADIKGTLKLALALHPKTRQILVIQDYTATGLAVRREMEAILPAFQGQVDITFTPNVPFAELERQLQALPADTVVLLATYVTDRDGRVFTRAESTQRITAASPVPVYGLHETRLGHGIVGGLLMEGENHGAQAAELALRVLAGEAPSSIPIIRSHSHPMFDDVQLRRFGIAEEEEAVPADSQIINRPVSFFTEHQRLVATLGAILSVLVLAIFILSLALGRTRNAEAALRISQARYRQVVETANEGVWMIDENQRTTFTNARMAQMLGYTTEEMIGRIVESFSFPDDLPEHRQRMEARRHGASDHYERRFRQRDGSALWTLVSAMPLTDEQGQFQGSFGMFIDITARKQAEDAVKKARERLEMALEGAGVGFYEADLQTGEVMTDDRFLRMLGYAPGEIDLTVSQWMAQIHPEDLPPIQAAYEYARQNGGEHALRYENEYRMRHQSGEWVWILDRGRVFSWSEQGRPLHSAGTHLDITLQKRIALKLADEQALLHNLIDSIPDMLFYKDLHGVYLGCNRAFAALLDRPEAEIVGHTDFDLVDADAALFLRQKDRLMLSAREPRRNEEWAIYPDGQRVLLETLKTPYYGPTGEVLGLIGVSRDITERREAETAIHRLVYYDPLTELPNRRLFLDRLTNAQSAARRGDYYGAALIVDLDAFQQINDARGHTVGDQILKEVATRLTDLLREDDVVARAGGDEFLVLLPDLAQSEDVAAHFAGSVAEKIRSALAVPFALRERDYALSASVGVTLFPRNTEVPQDVLKEADTAMHRAKAAGRNAVRFFETVMQTEVESRFALESDLRHAISRDELRLYLQPQVNENAEIVGAEALVRWQHPIQGLVPPMAFIPVAEETGLIISIGAWVLETACRYLTQLAAAGHPLRLAVNVSPRQFRQPHFVASVKATLAATGADPVLLTLEVTEGLVIEDIEETIAKMVELKALGLHLSLDDFGTGYSSLSYLKRLPIDELKIDKSFVQDVPQDAALVEVILAVARHLRLEVVAEGVETGEQAAFLKTRGCPFYQGYFYGKPQPAEILLQAVQIGGVARHP